MGAYSRILLPWDSQPQERAELNGDYAPAFVWNPAIGLLTPALGNQLSATGTVTQSVGQHGRAANLASSAYLTRANYAPIVTSNGVWTGDFTAFVIANPSASINPRALLSQRLDGGALSQFNIQANANTAFSGESGTVQFSTNSTASTTTSATGIIDGKYHVFGIRRIGTTLTGWVDGVEVATVTGTARAIGSASAGFGIGIAPPIYNILGAVDVAFAAGFNVGIVDMADVSRNVWRATFTPRTIWVPVSAAAGGGYTLTADAGAYVIGGQDAALVKSRIVVADAGAYSLAGQDAALTYAPAAGAYTLTAEAGAYVLAGQDAALKRGRVVSADAGAYALAGQDATLTYAPPNAYTLTCEAGAYAIGGQAATIAFSGATQATTGGWLGQRRRTKREIDNDWRKLVGLDPIEDEPDYLPEAAEVAEAVKPQRKTITVASLKPINVDNFVSAIKAKKRRRDEEFLLLMD